ncbi:glycosyltransferase [Isoptericola sp. NPDC055881]
MSTGPRVLVVCSLEPWDDVWRRNQHLVSRLLTADPALRVLFVEPPADPLHAAVHRRRPRLGRGLRRATADPGFRADGAFDGIERLWLYQPTKWLPRRLAPRGDVARCRAVVRAARRSAGLPELVWVNDPSYAAVLGVTPVPVVYDVTDDWLAARRPDAEIARLTELEHRLLRGAAAVTVCSTALRASKGTDRRDVVLVTNGVDLDAYARPTARPDDLPPPPVALYVGTLHADRLDVDLCEQTALALAADRATVVLLGPDALEEEDRARLRRAGVHLPGPRPFDAVPAYATAADVLLVPHVVDGFTDSLDPIKLYEYRAARRPVVATPVAGFRDTADPAVRAVAPERFADAARASLHLDPSERPTAADLDDLPTWDRQAGLMAATLADAVRVPLRRGATRR